MKTTRVLKNTKALSPVIATIILVAVTVAIAIAVAAWLGALTFSYTRTEQMTITQITFITSSPRTVTFSLANTGTSDITITTIQAQGNAISGTASVAAPSGSIVPKGGTFSLTVTFAQTAFTSPATDFQSGSRYDFTLVTTQGHNFPSSTIR